MTLSFLSSPYALCSCVLVRSRRGLHAKDIELLLVRVLESRAVFVLEGDLTGRQVDPLEQSTDSHLAGESAESGRPGTWRVEHNSGNSVARSREGGPLRALARRRVSERGRHEQC